MSDEGFRINTFSPTPWQVVPTEQIRKPRFIRDFEGFIIADIRWNEWMEGDVLANANLIAAAPDMFKVLKQIEFMSGGRPRCPMCAGWMASPQGETDHAHSETCALDAAIKKAEGVA